MAAQKDLDDRRKRALYRACHRGTKEMDWLLGRYAEAKLVSMGADDLDAFETLLGLPDPDLQNWITGNGKFGLVMEEFGGLIDELRLFHGLGAG